MQFRRTVVIQGANREHSIVGTIGNTYGSGSWNSWEQLSGTYRVRHHSSWSKFCRNSWSRHIAMFSCNMASYSIISCKSPGAIGTRNTDTLMSLANVGAEIGFITIGTLTKRTFEFRAWKIKQTNNQTKILLRWDYFWCWKTGSRQLGMI